MNDFDHKKQKSDNHEVVSFLFIVMKEFMLVNALIAQPHDQPY